MNCCAEENAVSPTAIRLISDSRKAFTLFEVLISLAVTGVIAYIVFSMSQSLVGLWRQVGSKVSMEVDANFALDVIERDLESALFLNNGLPMFAVTAISKSKSGSVPRWETANYEARHEDNDFIPPEIRSDTAGFEDEFEMNWTGNAYGWAGSWLRFFTAAPTVNAVSYRIVRRGTFGGSESTDIPVYVLHRAVVRQDRTLDAGYDITADAYNPDSPNGYSGHPDEIAAPTLSSYLVENVVDFGVRLYIYENNTPPPANSTNGMRCIFPIYNEADVTPDDREHVADTREGTEYDARYPDVVGIYLRILSKEGADKLKALESKPLDSGQSSSETYEAIVKKHGRLVTRFVECRVEGI